MSFRTVISAPVARLLVCCLLSLLLGGGCSSFNYEWRQTVKKSDAPQDAKLGPWEGAWTSEPSGHSGRLRCLLSPGGPTGTQARFRATYARILTFEYKVPLRMTPQSDGQKFEGSANLGKLAGGVYSYDGFLSSTQFFSTYKCRYDHGVFRMTRPQPRR
ncbi:MAG: hypothetical protein HY299_03045 [Verrucomicrobia bacterium]|nr:hypothetical protein [Verrucomicrobiota bacterium]